MSEQDVDGLVRRILAKHGNLNADAMTIDETQDLYAVGLSSLATVTVVMAIEDALDIELPDTVLSKATFSSIANIKDTVQSLGGC